MKKIGSLLLAVLLIAGMVTPVLAVEDSSSEPYTIWVDGVSFSSDEAASADTWSYNPEKNRLTLSNYDGAGIYSYGDLTIWAYGETTIRGENVGIYCDGKLTLECGIGILSVYGETVSSESNGAYAICATEEVWCCATRYTFINLYGGSCDQEGYYGGDALCAPVVTLTGYGQINVTGGSATYPSLYGGYAIYADTLYVCADSTLQGGSGMRVSEAVYCYEYCAFYHVDATVKASGAGASAFGGVDSLSYYYTAFSRTDDFSEWMFTAHSYSITLDGAGGTREEEGSLVLNAEFLIEPPVLQLSDYVFTRPGYTLVGWQDSNGTVWAIDASYETEFSKTSSENITLTAVWEAIPTVPMYRMYDPNGGEHFYTGSEEERDVLDEVGWNYEGVAFNFPAIGAPVYRLYDVDGSGDHLYTMDLDEVERLVAAGWNNEGVAFNSAADTEVPQYRLYNPNAHVNGTRGAWHFTGSEEERDWLIGLGWQYQGIGWYSTQE